MTIDTLEQHEALVASLMDAGRWVDGGAHRRRVDTHISTVVLAGDLAYKIKKPIDLGFLDFLGLDDRRAACDEEIRLNRRMAAEVYLGVSAVTGSIDAPGFDGPGEPIDWAVRMRRFDPEAVLSNPAVALSDRLIGVLAERVGRFHRAADRVGPNMPFGTPDTVGGPMRDNFAQLRELHVEPGEGLDAIETWTDQALRLADARLARRRHAGLVREGHGDLHLGNIALIDAQPVVFDAIEFDPALRWIDVIDDVAFLTMDLHHRGHGELVYRFLDGYLQVTGDYSGMAVLQLYEVYRAMVRAKIAAIRRSQVDDPGARRPVEAEFAAYLALAGRLSRPRRGAVLITHGASGSGKSYRAAQIVGRLPAVRLRSDVERKRLLGVDADDDATARGGYSAELTERTYAHLAGLAGDVAMAGYVAVVDATFLHAPQRRRFRELAQRIGVPFAILDVGASASTMRARIVERRQRTGNVSDAGLDVLDRQLRDREPLSDAETALSVRVAPERSLDMDRLRGLLGV